MEIIFPLIQWIVVILAGLVFGSFTLRYLLDKPRIFVLVAGWAFYLTRLPFEYERPDRVIGAALLWTAFSVAMIGGDILARRRMN